MQLLKNSLQNGVLALSAIVANQEISLAQEFLPNHDPEAIGQLLQDTSGDMEYSRVQNKLLEQIQENISALNEKPNKADLVEISKDLDNFRQSLEERIPELKAAQSEIDDLVADQKNLIAKLQDHANEIIEIHKNNERLKEAELEKKPILMSVISVLSVATIALLYIARKQIYYSLICPFLIMPSEKVRKHVSDSGVGIKNIFDLSKDQQTALRKDYKPLLDQGILASLTLRLILSRIEHVRGSYKNQALMSTAVNTEMMISALLDYGGKLPPVYDKAHRASAHEIFQEIEKFRNETLSIKQGLEDIVEEEAQKLCSLYLNNLKEKIEESHNNRRAIEETINAEKIKLEELQRDIDIAKKTLEKANDRTNELANQEILMKERQGSLDDIDTKIKEANENLVKLQNHFDEINQLLELGLSDLMIKLLGQPNETLSHLAKQAQVMLQKKKLVSDEVR